MIFFIKLFIIFKDGTETMSEGEVVHCTFCLHTEGDGMMVQCESCLTWQHGSCLGIESADQVNLFPFYFLDLAVAKSLQSTRTVTDADDADDDDADDVLTTC